jgi:hypothetical protein
MDLSFPEEERQKRIDKIINDVLGKQKASIFIGGFVLKEDDKKKRSVVTCNLQMKQKTILIEGAGIGAIDALYNGINEKLNKEFPSLDGIRFDDFSVRVKFKESRKWNNTDAPVEIKLALKNDIGDRIYFHAVSRSLVVSAIAAIRKAIEFLINSELAVIQLKKDIHSAKTRRRQDLINRYTAMLSELIFVADYQETIKKMKIIVDK